jgi:hypothetical protein
LGHTERVSDIAGHNLQVFFDGSGQKFQETPIIPGVVPDQGPNAGSQFRQPLHQVAADEATGAGNQDALTFPLHVWQFNMLPGRNQLEDFY